MIKVYKFGGASVRNADAVKNVASILEQYKGEKIVVIVSAMGKMTNALEKVVNTYVGKSEATGLMDTVKQAHYAVMEALFPQGHEVFNTVNDLFVEVDWVLEDEPHDSYDYIYDQIVSIGELVTSRILAAYLKEVGLDAVWQDARDLIRTNETYREGKVEWPVTETAIREQVLPLLDGGQLVVSQGFIGSTSENNTTTLGREGSDYTAAIFSYCLDAGEMHIWKDVPGVLTGDPHLFSNVSKIDRLSYKEAIEMTYYGAKVIHPKTIKPIQNKRIPLHVRSFIHPEENGTMVGDFPDEQYPPVVVVAPHQIMLNISTKDFSFVAEEHLSHLFLLFSRHRIKVNMMRNTAISFAVCIDNIPEKVSNFLNDIKEEFQYVSYENMELITVRHFNEDTLEPLRRARVVLFEERIGQTIQMVMKTVPVMDRKMV